MTAATRRVRRSWKLVVAAIAAAPLAVACWIGWAAKVSGWHADDLAVLCAQRPGFKGNHIGPITEARWEWFPPGLRCSADYGRAAGERRFWEPSWMDVAVPTLLVFVVIAWFAVAAARFLRAVGAGSPPMRILGATTLIVAAEALAVTAFPVSFGVFGAALLVWAVIALPLVAVLLVAAKRTVPIVVFRL
ncbi:MAG: hypothetical protein ACRD0P_18635 [Stackebrandtia sp.]